MPPCADQQVVTWNGFWHISHKTQRLHKTIFPKTDSKGYVSPQAFINGNLLLLFFLLFFTCFSMKIVDEKNKTKRTNKNWPWSFVARDIKVSVNSFVLSSVQNQIEEWKACREVGFPLFESFLYFLKSLKCIEEMIKI